jgi:beta-glucuronidase
MNEINQQSPIQRFFHRFKTDRIKIEFFPALINLPLVAVFMVLLITNRGYWQMFNWIIAGVFGGVYLEYITILLGILGVVAGISLLLILFGITHHLDWVHKPALNILPTFFLALMDAILITVLGINDRVGLDYIFFSLGPEKAEAVYMAVSLAIFFIIGFIVLGVITLLRSPKSGDTIKRKKTLFYTGKVFHPKLAALTTLISTGLAVPVVWAVLFQYPYTEAYWANIETMFTRYMQWTPVWLSLWIGGLIAVIMGQVLLGRQPGMNIRVFGFTLLFLGSGSQLIGLILGAALMDRQTFPYITGLSAYFWVPGLLLLFLEFFPQLGVLYRKFLSVKLEGARSGKFVKIGLIALLLMVPYWFIFYQPLFGGVPGVDLPSLTHLRTINGIEVPFQNGTAYPGFEFQSDQYRKYMNLSGQWKFWRGNGYDPNSLSPRTPELVRKLTQGQHRPDFNDAVWEVVHVPHSVTYYEDAEHYWGVVWYRRWIEITSDMTDMSHILKFYGVNYFCDVWIDGAYIGYHEGNFNAFAFDVTTLLTPGVHLLAVRVDNPQWDVDFPDRIVPDGCDFFNYGGIEREVWLESVPALSVVRVDVHQGDYQTDNFRNGTQQLSIDIVMKRSLTLETAGLELGVYSLEFPDDAALQSRKTWEYIQWTQNATDPIIRTLTMDAIGVDEFAAVRIDVDLPSVNYWSTKSPHLYAVTVNLSSGPIADFYCTQVGFRHIDVQGTNLTLNGANLKLAGVSVHEQYPYPTGRSLIDAQHFTDLALIKNLSANWWRGSYPFHPISYLFSDRLGLACWEEAPIFWINEIDVVQAYSRNYYQSLWIEILYRDFNRPSVLFWGATNETWAQGPLYTYLQDLREWMDQKDPSRIVSFAAVSSHDSWTQGFKHLRVCTPNTYAGTFEGVQGDWYNELTRQLWRVGNNTYNRGKPIMSMEFGYWRSGDDETQKRCFEECFRAYSEHPAVQGMTWWVFADYFGQDYYNAMGVYNHARTWYSPVHDSMRLHYGQFLATNL